MEEILHHLGCKKPCKYWDKLPINWLAGFPPSTVRRRVIIICPASITCWGSRIKLDARYRISSPTSGGQKNLLIIFRLHPKKGHKWANNNFWRNQRDGITIIPPLFNKRTMAIFYTAQVQNFSPKFSLPPSSAVETKFSLGQFFRPWPNRSIKKTIWVLFIRIRDIKFQGQSILSHSDILTAPENLAVVQHTVFCWQMVTFKGLRVFAA